MLLWISLSKSSNGYSSMGASFGSTPALLTSTSRRPKASMAASTQEAAVSGSPRSPA